MLRRDDIAAVVIAVAISASPGIIKRALGAGKHVLSEKPIAPDVQTAKSLIEYHQKEARDVLWGVAENFRFWASVDKAAQIIQGLSANLVTFSVTAYSFADAKNPFYNSEWLVNSIVSHAAANLVHAKKVHSSRWLASGWRCSFRGGSANLAWCCRPKDKCRISPHDVLAARRSPSRHSTCLIKNRKREERLIYLLCRN